MSGTEEARSLTARIAGFAAGLRFEDLPGDVVEMVKLHLLDTIGCALAGAGSDLARRCLAVARAEAGAGPCPVLGTSVGLPPAAAAFANGAAMNALDYDDGLELDGKGLGHPGATLAAAALSGAAMAGTSGRELLVALAVAYEVNARLILAIQPSHARFRQVYGVGQHQGLGAALAYGRCLGLGPDELANALGFAGTLTPLPSLRKYNWEKPPLVSFKDFNAPTAEIGVRAVQLAQAGLVGAADVLDGEAGFWRMIGSDRFDPGLLADDLGVTWWAREASFKAWPVCRWIHTALESFEAVRDAERIDPDAIHRIVVLTSAGLARDFMNVAPGTMVDRQFSLPFALANAAGRRPKTAWHEPSPDPMHARVAHRVSAEVDPEIDALMSGETRRPAGQVRVELADGRVLAGPRLHHPLGTRERPLPREAILAKFHENAAVAISRGAAEAIAEAIGGLETRDGLPALLGGAVGTD